MSTDFSFDAIEQDPSIAIDPSTDRPMGSKPPQWTEEWWAQAGPEVIRCVGHKKNGGRCKHSALKGSKVCAYHGGRAPQVQARAKIRIQEATDKAARGLLDMASDTTIPEGVRLSAIKDILDRGGLGVRQSVDIEVSAKPFERVFDQISAGLPESDPIDAEIEEEEDAGSLKARLVMRNKVDEYSDLDP